MQIKNVYSSWAVLLMLNNKWNELQVTLMQGYNNIIFTNADQVFSKMNRVLHNVKN